MLNKDQQSHRYKKCSICGVRRMPKSNILLSNFPLDPDRCRLWVKASGIEDFVHLPIEKLHELKYICGAHFTRECFNEKGNRLLKSAVPTLGLSRPPLPDDIFTEFPLHTKAYYKKKSNVKRNVLADCTNTISVKHTAEPDVSSSETSSHLIYKSVEPMSMPMEKSTNIDEYIPIASSSNAPPHLTFKRVEPMSMTMETSTNIDEYVPVASSSKAPPHLTFKRDELAKQDSNAILVQSYKRSKKSDDTHGADNISKREKRLLKRLQQSKISLKMLANSLVDLDKLNLDILKSIIENVAKNQKKKPHGKRWNLKTKISALAIFKRSPKAYRYIQNILPLPSTRTLQRILKEIPMEPGINSQIMKILKKKGQEMEERDKYCTLLFDEIALKKRLIYNENMDKIEGYVDLGSGDDMGRRNEIAGHALLFMVQGLRRKFKQPIAHYFVKGTIDSEKLAVLIREITKAVHESGFIVLSTVCDQGPTNIGALNLLKKFNCLPPEANYFLNEERKVFIMFDVPHLFKSIRNNFHQAGVMTFNGRTARWSHLKEAEERNRNFLNFKKINQTVVNPTYRIKMRVKYAAHALSNTMAAVLKMMAWNNDKTELNDTAYVVEEMDKLFDYTNGPASSNDVKKGIRENVSKKTKHEEMWNYYLKHLNTIKFYKSDTQIQLKNVRCIKGFQISLNSLKDIWNFLHKEAGYSYLNLRQLNQDSLENLFGMIRQHSVTNRNPTCSHFNAALKTSIVSGLTGVHSRGSNCQIDCNKLFISYEELTHNKQSSVSETQTCDNKDEHQLYEETDIDYPVLSIPEQSQRDVENLEDSLNNFEEQPIVYVSGYLAARILSKLKCEKCTFYLKEENPNLADDMYKYISLKEWWHDKISLTYPKKNYV